MSNSLKIEKKTISPLFLCSSLLFIIKATTMLNLSAVTLYFVQVLVLKSGTSATPRYTTENKNRQIDLPPELQIYCSLYQENYYHLSKIEPSILNIYLSYTSVND